MAKSELQYFQKNAVSDLRVHENGKQIDKQ